jgi:hypothetical protein
MPRKLDSSGANHRLLLLYPLPYPSSPPDREASAVKGVVVTPAATTTKNANVNSLAAVAMALLFFFFIVLIEIMLHLLLPGTNTMDKRIPPPFVQ